MNARHTLLRHGSRAGLLMGLALSAGCYDEGLVIRDLVGEVRLPKEAATFEFTRPALDDNGDPITEPGSGDPVFETEEVTDVRLIGPVYIGLYASVREDLFSYPYPETGPVTGAVTVGDTYPYGGTTIGDFRYACYEFFQCKMVSGRYASFEGILEWWNDVVGDPVVDAGGDVVEVADAFRDTCYQLRRWTSDAEARLTVTSDRNGDGELDAGDLDFVEDGDVTKVVLEGDFEVDVKQIPGVPRLLAGRIAPQIEKFIVQLIQPNLEKTNQAVGTFLDAQG